MAITAKMYVESAKGVAWRGSKTKNQEEVRLVAVYSTGEDDPNSSWSAATPSGTLELMITNPKVFGYLEPGAEYYIEIRKSRSDS